MKVLCTVFIHSLFRIKKSYSLVHFYETAQLVIKTVRAHTFREVSILYMSYVGFGNGV